MGITRNQLHAGFYVIILEQKDGPLRLPIIVGTAEAQSIAVKLEGVVPPRPLAHDLMVSVFHRFGIFPEEVEIYDFDSGVFSSNIRLIGQDGTEQVVDSRTSDAVAIAVRVGCPIYVSREILEHAGFVPDEDGVPVINDTPLEALPIGQLEERLQQCIEREDYELAAQIKKIIEQKMQQS